jgi:hypothetical protein
MISSSFHSAGNPKSEFRNPKWFDQLTTLSHVEGQNQMTKILMPQIAALMTEFSFWSLGF